MSYRDYLTKSAPGFLQGPNAQAFLAGVGAAIDQQVVTLTQAVEARFPNFYNAAGVFQTPPDALAAIGDERGLGRAVDESDASYGARLQGAWETWGFAGSAYGLLKALSYAGLGGAYIVQQNGIALSLDASGNLVVTALNSNAWTFDLNATLWSRFSIVYPLGQATFTAAQQATLNTLVNQWKPALATYMGAEVITSGELWGWPTGLWGDAGTWGGTAVSYT